MSTFNYDQPDPGTALFLKKQERVIKRHLQTLGKAAYGMGRLALGDNATLKQIANHVGREMGIDPDIIASAMLTVEGGVRNE